MQRWCFEMARRVTSAEAHAWLEENFRARTDLGFCKAVANLVLDPRNPFEPGARRKPKKGFLLGALLLTAAVVFLIYFNFVS